MVSPAAGAWMVRMLEQGENSCSGFTGWATAVSAFTSLVNAKLTCPCGGSKELLSPLCCVWRMSLWLERDGSVTQDLGAWAPSCLLPCMGAWAPVSLLVRELRPLWGQNICKFGIMQLFKRGSVGLGHLIGLGFFNKYIGKKVSPIKVYFLKCIYFKQCMALTCSAALFVVVHLYWNQVQISVLPVGHPWLRNGYWGGIASEMRREGQQLPLLAQLREQARQDQGGDWVVGEK